MDVPLPLNSFIDYELTTNLLQFQVWQALALLNTFRTTSEDTDSSCSIPNSKNSKETRIGRFLTLPSHKYRYVNLLVQTFTT